MNRLGACPHYMTCDIRAREKRDILLYPDLIFHQPPIYLDKKQMQSNTALALKHTGKLT